jgi:hypothetical protein
MECPSTTSVIPDSGQPSDRVVVTGYRGKQVEGLVVSLDGGLIGITTLAERVKAENANREPVVIAFPARDVKLMPDEKAAKP